jgi:hypothetical protein
VTAEFKISTALYHFIMKGSELRYTDSANVLQLVHSNFTETLAGATSRFTNEHSFIYDNSIFGASGTVVTNIPFKQVAGFRQN